MLAEPQREAQDELIKFLLAPMQRQLDEINAKAEAERIERETIEEMIKQGRCVASYCVFCPCKSCDAYSRATDVVYDKPENIAALDALISAGFDIKSAQNYVEIFDELGILTDEELFCLPG